MQLTFHVEEGTSFHQFIRRTVHHGQQKNAGHPADLVYPGLVCALLIRLLPAAFAAGSDPDFSAPADKVLISQTNYPIVNGLTESQVILNNASGSAQVLGYMATITPGASVKLKASYPNYYTGGQHGREPRGDREEPRLGSEDDHVPGRRL